jgi:hypothetical protein
MLSRSLMCWMVASIHRDLVEMKAARALNTRHQNKHHDMTGTITPAAETQGRKRLDASRQRHGRSPGRLHCSVDDAGEFHGALAKLRLHGGEDWTAVGHNAHL